MPCGDLCYCVYLDDLWYRLIPCVTLLCLMILCDTVWCRVLLCDMACHKFVKQISATSYDKFIAHMIKMILGLHREKPILMRYSDCVSMWCHHKLCVFKQLSPNRALYKGKNQVFFFYSLDFVYWFLTLFFVPFAPSLTLNISFYCGFRLLALWLRIGVSVVTLGVYDIWYGEHVRRDLMRILGILSDVDLFV